ncbi:MAG: penicillin-insensitive murein endopeptidase [Myxococcota bacterium]
MNRLSLTVAALALVLPACGGTESRSDESTAALDDVPCAEDLAFEGEPPPGFQIDDPCATSQAYDFSQMPEDDGSPWWQRGHGTSAPAEPTVSHSISVGTNDEGSLLHAVRVEESPHLRYVPAEVRGRGGGRFWGTAEIAAFVRRLGQQMATRFRGTQLSIGELSAQEGGPIPGHRSHQAGRDVDFAFYMRDDHRRWATAERFVPIGERGHTMRRGRQRLYFDAEANWVLLERMLLDEEANVQFIFVAEHLQDMLLDEARRVRAPESLRRRARAVMREPEEHSHDNHFHVRIYCSPEDKPRCRDDAPERPRYGYPEASARDLRQAQERARRLRLGRERTGVTLLRQTPPARWLEEVVGRVPRGLLWPVREGRYGRGFGFTRVDLPNVPHNGVDIGAPTNAVVLAAADGMVAFAGEFRSFGNCVFLLHKNGWVTTYAHNARNTVIPGMMVRRGDPIGLVGSTGVSRGPHVHFELRDNGSLRDPEEVLEEVRRWGDGERVPQRIPSSLPAEPAVEETPEIRRGPQRIDPPVQSEDPEEETDPFEERWRNDRWNNNDRWTTEEEPPSDRWQNNRWED